MGEERAFLMLSMRFSEALEGVGLRKLLAGHCDIDISQS